MKEISEFGIILLFIIGAIAFFMVSLLTARLLRPHRPNIEKLTTYESGEEPVGSAWGKFTIRFYVVALIFILFEVELVFLFPWAIVYGDKTLQASTQGLWGWVTLAEMAVFIGILALGLAYVWVKGHLDWVKPEAVLPTVQSAVPMDVYDKVNAKYSSTTKAMKR